jgi:DNA invertase Pin-like site-specific DNA recombinase
VVRCAIYPRVSDHTEADKDFTTIDNQIERSTRYMESQEGWTLVKTYDEDGRSAKDMHRPKLQEMLADIRAGKIDVVIVYKIDRLSRSLRDFVDMMDLFEKHGVTFVSVTQQFSTGDALGKFTLGMLALFAQFEREMTVERTRDKIAGMRQQGMWSGGMAPLGYDLIEGRLVVNADEAETVRYIFDRYLEWRSARLVAQALNEADRPVKQRGEMTPEGWTKDIVLRVLRNVVYTGVIEHDGTLYPGRHEPLISRETYEQAESQLNAGASEGEWTGRARHYLLQGVMHCECGSIMTPSASGNDNGKYRYYRCSAQEKGTPCESSALPADAIESFVVDRIHEIASDGQIAAALRTQMEALASAQREPIAAQISELRAKQSAIVTRGEALANELVGSTGETRRLVERQIKALAADEQPIANELANAEQRATALSAAERETKWIADQLKSFPKVWPTLKPDLRGRVIRALVRSIRVNESQHQLTIMFAPLDDTRRALLADASENPLASMFVANIHRERGRAVSFTTQAPPAPRGPAERPAKIASMLALAHAIDREIRAGTYTDLAEVSRMLGMTRARLSQFMGLTFLAPDIQEELLSLTAIDGREPFRERTLRRLLGSPVWHEQRAVWATLRPARTGAPAPADAGKGGAAKAR